HAEAQAVVALTGIAMLLPLGPAVPAQAGAVQVAEINLPRRVVGLALPVLDLHALGRGPDARLAVAAQAALLGHQRLPQSRLVGVIVVVGMRLLAMLGQGRGLRPLLDGPHLLGALKKADQRTGPGQFGLVLAQLAFELHYRGA